MPAHKKLNPAQIEYIKRIYAAGLATQKELSIKYRVGLKAIRFALGLRG